MHNEKLEIYKKENKFICKMTDYNLVTRGSSAQEAYDKIQKCFTDYKSNLLKYGLEVEDFKKHKKPEFELCSIENKKKFINLIVLILFFFGAGVSFKYGFKQLNEKINVSTKSFKSLSEEEKLEIISSKAKMLKPYIQEIKKVINE